MIEVLKIPSDLIDHLVVAANQEIPFPGRGYDFLDFDDDCLHPSLGSERSRRMAHEIDVEPLQIALTNKPPCYIVGIEISRPHAPVNIRSLNSSFSGD